jgi:hypothetical protein
MGWGGSHAAIIGADGRRRKRAASVTPAFAHSRGPRANPAHARVCAESAVKRTLFRHRPGERRCMPLDAAPSAGNTTSAS